MPSLHESGYEKLASYERHPMEDMEPEPVQMIPIRDALEAIIFVVMEIRGARNARLSVDCFAAAVGLLTYENKNMADIARSHGVSREAIRRRVENFQTSLGEVGNLVRGATFQKNSEVGETYSKCNHRNHKI